MCVRVDILPSVSSHARQLRCRAPQLSPRWAARLRGVTGLSWLLEVSAFHGLLAVSASPFLRARLPSPGFMVSGPTLSPHRVSLAPGVHTGGQ